MRDHKRKKSNHGFSLVEVLVVVLILGIVSGITVLNISYAYRNNAKRSAEKISALLDLARSDALSRVDGTIVLRLKEESGEVTASILVTGAGGTDRELTKEVVASSSIDVFVNKGGGDVQITGATQQDISFVKSSGAFKADINGKTVEKIRLKGSHSETIILVKETGRNYVQ